MTDDFYDTTRVFVAQRPPGPPVPSPWPAPEVPARKATAAELVSCNAARLLCDRAETAGWDVEAVFARGYYSREEVADLLVLRFRWDQPRTQPAEAVACWDRRGAKGWSFDEAVLPAPWAALTSAEIRDWLTPPSEHDHQCYDEPCSRDPFDRRQHYLITEWLCICGKPGGHQLKKKPQEAS